MLAATLANMTRFIRMCLQAWENHFHRHLQFSRLPHQQPTSHRRLDLPRLQVEHGKGRNTRMCYEQLVSIPDRFSPFQLVWYNKRSSPESALLNNLIPAKTKRHDKNKPQELTPLFHICSVNTRSNQWQCEQYLFQHCSWNNAQSYTFMTQCWRKTFLPLLHIPWQRSRYCDTTSVALLGTLPSYSEGTGFQSRLEC